MVIEVVELANQMDCAFYEENGYYQSSTEPMIFACKVAKAYAELHRQEALKQASQKARKQHVCTGGASYYIVNKDSILNAYSKKNIR
jgi:hypothetical protein